MSDKDKPFDRMVNFLVETYGMSLQGAQKLVVQSSEAIYTIREQLKFKATYEKLRHEQSEDTARIEACKAVVNNSPTWEMVADEAHRYQLAGPFL